MSDWKIECYYHLVTERCGDCVFHEDLMIEDAIVCSKHHDLVSKNCVCDDYQ